MNTKPISVILMAAFCFLAVTYATAQTVKTYNSYRGLVMAGYQGWFSTPDDGGNRGWYHYQGKQGFKPGSTNVDLWPDVSEYEKTYESPFTYDDGTKARLFSSRDASSMASTGCLCSVSWSTRNGLSVRPTTTPYSTTAYARPQNTAGRCV